MTPISEPFLFGNWETTPDCNDTCGAHRYKIKTRTCTPVGPGPYCENLEESLTMTADIKSPCLPFVPCSGSTDNFPEKHLKSMDYNTFCIGNL